MSIPLNMAKEQELIDIGVAPTPPDHLSDRLLAEVRRMMKFSRSLRVMLESCTKCGACAQACHSYLGTNDSFNIPALRADLLRTLYQRNFTPFGKLIAWVTGARAAGPEEINHWIEYSYQCNLCRRCSYYCPFGIDTAEIIMAMRYILAKVGLVPRFTAGIVANTIKAGNNTGILKPAIVDCCEFLEGELLEEPSEYRLTNPQQRCFIFRHQPSFYIMSIHCSA